ncbi:hypothetical protein ACLB6G_06715 [Zhengella sp. ZM62]|uniref:hypothetical protein n=1 Tax=Zhengella sedimenti TaxID=3390035 RepID=UPI0039768E49
MTEIVDAAALWWAVVAVGIYHGVNPGMGWPLAVSAALMESRARALVRSLAALAAGHFASMALMLLPFTAMSVLVSYEYEIRVVASVLVMAMGLFLLVWQRHPRFLSRVRPSQLALWSFLAALAHGAGLMLVPMYLGLCRVDPDDTGHLAAISLMAENLVTALLVATVHTAAMIVSGGLIAVIVYRWLGLRVLSRTWFNLDRIWALSLVVVGLAGLFGAFDVS